MFTCIEPPSSPIQTTELEVPNIPQCPENGNHMVTFDPTDLYIDRADFKEVTKTIITALLYPDQCLGKFSARN